MINDYNSLTQAVQNWLVRSDADLVNNLPAFIGLAEARHARDLRIRAMEQVVALAAVAGTNAVALPAGYLQTRRLLLSDAPEAPLTYLTPEQFYQQYDPSVTGRPAAYTIEGENLVLGPAPDQPYDLSMLMYRRLAPLSAGSPTNWLVANAPDVYLFSVLCEAEQFLMNDARAQMWEMRYQRAIGDCSRTDRDDRHSGSLRMQSDAPL